MTITPLLISDSRFKHGFSGYAACLRAVLVVSLTACFALATNICAAATTAPQNMKFKAVVEDIMETCVVTFDNAAGDTASFGQVMPSQIQASPSDTSLSTLIATSNFNGVYDTNEPMAILKISCPSSYSSLITSLSLKYGNISQDVAMANSTIRGYKLDHVLNQNVLAFNIHVRDRYALAWGRPTFYVSPGQERYFNPMSFQNVSGNYIAYLDIFPGLYWIDAANKNSAAGTISTSVDFVLTLN